jgi:hypothetical protein
LASFKKIRKKGTLSSEPSDTLALGGTHESLWWMFDLIL